MRARRQTDLYMPKVNPLRAWAGFIFHWLAVISFVLLVALVVWASSGCGTVTPKAAAAANAASFDGNEANSGIVSLGPDGFIVTPDLLARYVALVKSYGGAYSPPMKTADGVTHLLDGTIVMDRQHMVRFLDMNRWKRSGFPASPP